MYREQRINPNVLSIFVNTRTAQHGVSIKESNGAREDSLSGAVQLEKTLNNNRYHSSVCIILYICIVITVKAKPR